MKQARTDCTLLPAAQTAVEHGVDGSRDRHQRIARLFAAGRDAQPSPGSAEAMTDFHAACREHASRTQFHDEYRDLEQTVGFWTASDLTQALQSNKISLPDFARLHPMATERELRISAVEHELKLGVLFALAFAPQPIAHGAHL